MKRIRGIFWVVASALLATYGAPTAAQVAEVEPNYDRALTDPMSVAQSLTIGSDGTVTVDGHLESTDVEGDVDVYSFPARAGATSCTGDHITAEIVSSKSDVTGDIIDTFLAIHGPAPEYKALAWNDDKDAGAGNYNAYYSNYCINEDGVYYVIVTGAQNKVADGGASVIDGGNRDRGSYTLVISGLSPTVASEPPPTSDTGSTPEPSVMQISIEIKPWPGTVMARINPSAKGDIPVALLSAPGFNALEVDESSLRFGHSGDEKSLTRCLKRGYDVNRDGRPDKICHFDNRASKFEVTDDKGIVKGTIAGKSFEGDGMLKVIPEKRRRHHHSDRRHDRDDDHDRDRRGRR
jgi:hypothetical protein